VYPPGLPLVFALFQRLGGRPAVFYAVPVLGALAVWATYLLGSFIGGREAGAMAAVLLATSPVLLFQDLVAMSDVPVAAWWALQLVCLTSRRPVRRADGWTRGRDRNPDAAEPRAAGSCSRRRPWLARASFDA
jgi:4-amino-4-deoxy-L-arabinose transferase-like glycosyltransferase